MNAKMCLENVRLYLNNGEYYTSQDQLKCEIENEKYCLNSYKHDIFALCAGNPEELLRTKDNASMPIIDLLSDRLDEVLYNIADSSRHIALMEFFYDNFDKAKIEQTN